MPEVVTITPHLAPRNANDAATGCGYGCLQTVFIFILPAVVVGLLTRSALAGILVVAVIYALWLLFSVTKLRISEEGIRFVRVFGSPKLIRWTELESMAVAPPSEVVLYGWLWPPFPCREMTVTFTSIGHYRIVYGGKRVYFPPADPALFESTVASFRATPDNPSFHPS